MEKRAFAVVFVLVLLTASFALAQCVDDDGDGYGSVPDESCQHSQLDCDDTNPTVHPGAQEICDKIDNNCDGLVDEGCNSKDNGVQGAVSSQGAECFVAQFLGGALEAIFWAPVYQDSEGNPIFLGRDIKAVGEGFEANLVAAFYGNCEGKKVYVSLYSADGTRLFEKEVQFVYDETEGVYVAAQNWTTEAGGEVSDYYFNVSLDNQIFSSPVLTVNSSCTDVLCGVNAEERSGGRQYFNQLQESQCVPTDIYWMDETGQPVQAGIAGRTVTLTVEGSDCDGESATAEILEYDLNKDQMFDPDSAEIVDKISGKFEEGMMQADWIVKRVPDEEDNLWGMTTDLPEYIVKLTLQNGDVYYSVSGEGQPILLIAFTPDEYEQYKQLAQQEETPDGEVYVREKRIEGDNEGEGGPLVYVGEGSGETEVGGGTEGYNYEDQTYQEYEESSAQGFGWWIWIAVPVVLLLVIGGIVFFVWRRRKSRKDNAETEAVEGFGVGENMAGQPADKDTFQEGMQSLQSSALQKSSLEQQPEQKPLTEQQTNGTKGVEEEPALPHEQKTSVSYSTTPPEKSPFATEEQEKSVIEYIRAARVRNVDDETIKRILVNGSWKEDQVEYALKRA